MKFILGKKQNMTQIFDDKGRVIPSTLISAGPITITQIKTKEKDGYSAAQVNYKKKKKEFAISEKDKYNVGDKFNVGDFFKEGDIITVSGISKGKGFQGVVKRHGFHGGPRTHGQKHSEREPGSIGATGPQRVFKGMRMAGRTGGDRVTIKNLKVLKINKENNEIMISGAVPGRRGTLLEIISNNS